MITPDSLKRFAPRIGDAVLHAGALESARQSSSVNSPRRLCHFMGQVFVETAGFTAFEENLNYRDPAWLDKVFRAVNGVEDARALIARGPVAIANRAYANRLGNGDEASGDGWRFRGSGYKQLTGRVNYRDLGILVSIDLVAAPEMTRQPDTSAQIAFRFWDARNCSKLADAGDVESITACINGPAKLGLDKRRAATLKAMEIWS